MAEVANRDASVTGTEPSPAKPMDVVTVNVSLIEPGTPTMRRSPDELLQLVQSLRGFSSVEPPHALDAAQQSLAEAQKRLEANPSNKDLVRRVEAEKREVARISRNVVRFDPEGRGDPLGKGYRTYAALQLVNERGHVIATAIAESTGSGPAGVHAEEHAVNALRQALRGKKTPGAMLEVAVDQYVCKDRCQKALSAFGHEMTLQGVVAHHWVRDVSQPSAKAISEGVGETAVNRPSVVERGVATDPMPKQARTASPKTTMRTSTMGPRNGEPIARPRVVSVALFGQPSSSNLSQEAAAASPSIGAGEPPSPQRATQSRTAQVTSPIQERTVSPTQRIPELAASRGTGPMPPVSAAAKGMRAMKAILGSAMRIAGKVVEAMDALSVFMDFADGLSIAMGENELKPYLDDAVKVERDLKSLLNGYRSQSEQLGIELNGLFGAVDRAAASNALTAGEKFYYDSLVGLVQRRSRLMRLETEVRAKRTSAAELLKQGLAGRGTATLLSVHETLTSILATLGRSQTALSEMIRIVDLDRLSILNWRAEMDATPGYELPE